MNRNAILIPISFVVYVLLQILLFRRLVLFDTAFCFMYIGFLLFLPLEWSVVYLLLAGFGAGLLVDVFQNSAGLHAGATVLVAFMRNGWLRVITPQGGYVSTGTFRNLGLVWLLSYMVPLVVIHQMVLFFAEAGTFRLTGLTLSRVILSSFYTILVLFLMRMVFYGRR